MKKLLIILLFPVCVNAQTKFYLGTSTVSPIPTAFNAGWEVSAGMSRLMLYDFKDNSAIATYTSNNTGAAAVRDVGIRMFATVPLAEQTLAIGTVISAQVRGRISSTSSRTGRGKIIISVLNADGTVNAVVSTVTTTNYTTTLTNRTYSVTLGSTATIPAGGRLCFELGWEYLTGTNTATNGDNSYGAQNGTADLLVDNTSTLVSNPFINISVTVQKQKIGFF